MKVEAEAYLMGYIDDVWEEFGLPQDTFFDIETHKFIEEKDADADARRALSRLLRSGHPGQNILDALAELFDPDSDNDRKIILKYRNGRPPDHARNSMIVEFVELAHHHFGTLLKAFDHVGDRIGKSGYRIDGIYQEHRPAVTLEFTCPIDGLFGDENSDGGGNDPTSRS